jgi:hypothetical protein
MCLLVCVVRAVAVQPRHLEHKRPVRCLQCTHRANTRNHAYQIQYLEHDNAVAEESVGFILPRNPPVKYSYLRAPRPRA